MNLINIPLLNKSSMLKKPTGQCWSYKQKDSGLESGQKCSKPWYKKEEAGSDSRW